jgi:protein-L-isoaspartate(D-aspartate) O-methyltransferase
LGGKLLFPLGVPAPAPRTGVRHSIKGAALLIENRGPGFAASHIAPAYFVWVSGQGAEEQATLQKLTQAFDGGGIEFVRSFVNGPGADPARCWFLHHDWALSYDQPPI